MVIHLNYTFSVKTKTAYLKEHCARGIYPVIVITFMWCVSHLIEPFPRVLHKLINIHLGTHFLYGIALS